MNQGLVEQGFRRLWKKTHKGIRENLKHIEFTKNWKISEESKSQLETLEAKKYRILAWHEAKWGIKSRGKVP